MDVPRCGAVIVNRQRHLLAVTDLGPVLGTRAKAARGGWQLASDSRVPKPEGLVIAARGQAPAVGREGDGSHFL